MNIFFGGTFIRKEELEEAGIDYPIKLEYYKIINENELTKKDKSKYGIKVVKTEDETIKYLCSSEQKIDEILNILKNNEVTPIAIKDVISDISKSSLSI